MQHDGDAPGVPTVNAVLARNRDTFTTLLTFSVAMFAGALAAFYVGSSEAVGSLFASTRAGRDIVGCGRERGVHRCGACAVAVARWARVRRHTPPPRPPCARTGPSLRSSSRTASSQRT